MQKSNSYVALQIKKLTSMKNIITYNEEELYLGHLTISDKNKISKLRLGNSEKSLLLKMLGLK